MSLLAGACASDDGTAMNGVGDAADGGDRDGAVDELPPAESTASSLEGAWVATASPARLLRYPEGATAPADAIELDWDLEYVEIVDGVAFYLGDSIVSDGEKLHVQDLRSGERSDIAFSEESALAGLVFADGSLWVGDEALDVVWRVNPATLEVVGGTPLDNYDSDQNDGLELAASEDSVYVSSLFGDAAVLRIATASGEVEARQEEGGDGTTGVAVGEGAAWATSRFDGSLWRYGESDLALQETIVLEADISSMTRNVMAAFGSVWVLAGVGGNAQDIFGEEARPGIFRIDAASNEVLEHIPLESPRGLRATETALWVTTATSANRIDPASASIARTLTPAEGDVVDIAFALTGGGTGSTQGLEPIDVYSVVEPPAMVCEELGSFYNHGTAPLLESASGTLTLSARTVAFDQGVCKVLHNVAGEAVEYLAYLSDTLDEPTEMASVSITGYAGDGTYAARLRWDSEPGQSGSGSATATAVVSEGGMHVVVTSDFGDEALELDCGAGADVSMDARPMPEPGPGEVVVQTAEGTWLRFINMDCGSDILSEDLWVNAPEYFIGPQDLYMFDLKTNVPAEEGTLSGSVSFTYYGKYFSFEEVEVALTCGDPVTGTFTSESYSGSFTCR